MRTTPSNIADFSAACFSPSKVLPRESSLRKARVPYARRTPFPRRVKIARRLQIDLDTYQQVRGQVEGLPDEVLIKSQVFRDQEGRFHARHFWPQHVSGKHTTRRPGRGIFRSSRRERWFSDRHGWPLSGYDVAGSQTQILAVLLGLTDLEALTQGNYFTTKHYLAAQAMAKLPLRGTPSSAELVRVTKDLWTRVLYGGHLKEIVWDHFDVLVPGTFTRAQYLKARREAKRHPTDQQSVERARTYNDALKCAEQNLVELLEDIPWYGKKGEEQLSDFFRACKQIAKSAMHRDIYTGVTFIDPLAGTTIRWNPPRRQRVRMNCQGLQVALRLPGGWAGKRGTPRRRFIDAVPHHETGDYPVRSPKLKQAVAPGVIHLLDALFNALVVQALERAGVVDFIALHDCWLVPEVITQYEAENGVGREDWHSQEVLRAAIEQAGRAWLERLGPIYAGLVDALQGTEFEPWMRRLQAEWEQRVRDEKWPDFRVEPVVGVISLAWERDFEPVLAKLRGFNVSQCGEELSEDPEDRPPF
jgi:hypothetical protein